MKYKLVSIVVSGLLILTSLSISLPVYAVGLSDICNGSGSNSTYCHETAPYRNGGNCNGAQAGTTNACNPITGVNGILLKATNILSLIAGIAAVIMIVVGSFQMVV